MYMHRNATESGVVRAWPTAAADTVEETVKGPEDAIGLKMLRIMRNHQPSLHFC